MENFDPSDLKKLYRPNKESSGEDNGQVTIIGGSKLFHGATLLSLKVASRIVDMVFFGTPEKSVGQVAEQFKSKLFSFIWIPWEEIESYILKSDAVLIGPGFMSFRSEKDRAVVEKTKTITKKLLEKFPNKHWVIDAGSLQVMDTKWIPAGAILTPNKKEYAYLFGRQKPEVVAKKHNCIIVVKGSEAKVCSPSECIKIKNGNSGLTKGGTGDVLAGLIVAFLAKNKPFLAAASGSFITKAAADELYGKVGPNYNSDDLAEKIPETLHKLRR